MTMGERVHNSIRWMYPLFSLLSLVLTHTYKHTNMSWNSNGPRKKGTHQLFLAVLAFLILLTCKRHKEFFEKQLHVGQSSRIVIPFSSEKITFFLSIAYAWDICPTTEMEGCHIFIIWVWQWWHCVGPQCEGCWELGSWRPVVQKVRKLLGRYL